MTTTSQLRDQVSDQDFRDPYIDIDEWRDTPVKHRYVHGGFGNCDTRFSLYLPPAERYEGRFFQHFTPVPGSENLATLARGQEDKISFSLASGAYFVETNGGGHFATPGSATDPSIAAYRANAACARYSRVVAAEMYGDHRPWGYAFGGSGGAYRTISAAEHTEGVWDGYVPYVVGSPVAVPNVFSVRMHAQRVLRDKLAAIADAYEPGGGDPYEGLSPEQAAALDEVTRMGFPPRSWYGWQTMGTQAFGVIYPHVVAADPGYFEAFWTEPGYLGADPDSSIHADRFRCRARVLETITQRDAERLGLVEARSAEAAGGVDHAFEKDDADADAVVAVKLDHEPGAHVQGAEFVLLDGEHVGASFSVRRFQGAYAIFEGVLQGPGPDVIRTDQGVSIDNSNFLAAQTYHRHQVPPDGFPVWDQFRDSDGKALYPQRPFLMGPMFARAAAGNLQSGRISGKMIVVASLLDREAYPWQADWYYQLVGDYLGKQLEEKVRIWYTDNALHADEEVQDDPTHTVSYLGVLQHALRDLATWVEEGLPPAASTHYELTDGQIRTPSNAKDRFGVQPTVTLSLNGSTSITATWGTSIEVQLSAAVPPSAGKLVRVQWDLDGDGVFERDEAVAPSDTLRMVQPVVALEPGTRFITVLVTAQREGDQQTPFARIDNLARARLIVR